MKRKAARVCKVLACAVCALWLCLMAVECMAEPIETRIVTARGGLNVRREPNTNSPVIYMLEETTLVTISDWQDGWALVGYNSPPFMPIGWACGDWLK